MCLSVFLYSDAELPLVAWDPAHPGFNVSALEPFEHSARSIFAAAYVYALGAHTQCACGFQLTAQECPDDVRASVEGLMRYLRSAQTESDLHVYVCWNGDASPEEAIARSLSLEEMSARDDWLEENALTEIRRAAA